ncbi:MAG: amino acid adenylation domain-containing protein, partial [Rhizonema sp. PD38]|nr:amino acid adenylation domain-containing protein [Rhizonema sp. PD38]
MSQQTLPARYTDQEDIIIGSPIANRQSSELKSLIGFFVNTIVLRVDLSCNPTFEELLGRVRRMTLEAYEHQEVPFEKVVEALRPERYLNYSPLFQVMFDWQNALTAQWELPDLAIAHIPTTPVVGKFDLSLTIEETETMLEGRWEYNSHQFENEAIARMSEQFQTLLQGIVCDRSRPVRELPLLTASTHQLLAAWNSTQTDYPSAKCIHHLFEEQVQKTPDAVAVQMEDEQITYQELNKRASQLAHHLQTLGVKPEVLVGICVERSIHMVIGLLGILKAGGAYVPLDTQLPLERLAYILEDTQVPILLTQQKLVSNLPEHEIHLICIDTDWQVIGNLSSENPVSGAEADNLAYVIYTSGSTGSPKGVEIAHQSLVNFTSMAVQEYDINEQDRILQFASISFDTAAEEIYPCLKAGGTLVLRTDEMLSFSNQFWQQCRDWQLTVLDLPTAYWHYLTSLLTASDKRIPETLRLVIIGGERARPENVRKWLQSLAFLPNPPKLLNTYGPTEATVVTTLYQLPESTSSDTLDEVPIGRPMGNSQVYVLDQYLQSVPIGVPGELHIGGTGVARGYLNRPDLTKEKFIPNPNGYSKLYKTGDLVRYRPDGNLEFLGRIDNQVKIRGFRIELGEIEAAIALHPKVQATAVIAQEDKLGNKSLIAYIVFADNLATSSELRRFLQQKLPDYMIPTAWVKLDSIPLTNNGKVDYRALRVPEQEISREVCFAPPRDEFEQQLTQIWSEVLDVHPVGILDNFFELGGHSLLAFSLMARIQQQFGKTLPLTSIFQAATIEQFAAILRQKADSYTWSPLVKIQPNGSKPPLFLIHPGGASLLAYEDLISCMDILQPLYGVDALGFEEGQKPQDQVEEMARNYIEAIQTVQPDGPYLLAGWCFGGLVAFEMAQR